MSRLLLLHGKPGSGKSTAMKSINPEKLPSSIEKLNHFSIGDRMRAILSGSVGSEYRVPLENQATALSASARVSDALVGDIVSEYIAQTNTDDLTVLDGYPLYREQIPTLTAMVDEQKLSLLGLAEICVPDELAGQRMRSRGTRKNEDQISQAFIDRRLDEYSNVHAFTIRALAEVTPYFRIDGTQNVQQVSDELATVISTTASDLV